VYNVIVINGTPWPTQEMMLSTHNSAVNDVLGEIKFLRKSGKSPDTSRWKFFIIYV
jgi:hypothetical protein